MCFHTQQACLDAHEAEFEQTVVVYGACDPDTGAAIATAMQSALNSGAVPHVLSATVTYKTCAEETLAAGIAAAATVGAAGKVKAPPKKTPGSTAHKPVSAGGIRIARPQRRLQGLTLPVPPVSRLFYAGMQPASVPAPRAAHATCLPRPRPRPHLITIDPPPPPPLPARWCPCLQPPNAHYTVTIAYTSALVANVAGVKSTILEGSSRTADGFCNTYGVCDDLAAADR